MATKGNSSTLSDVNGKIKNLQDNQLRILVLLMATGQDFNEAYEISKSYGWQVPAANGEKENVIG